MAGPARPATVPEPLVGGIHARVVGWAWSPPDWVAVYAAGSGGGWCGLEGTSWWDALVEAGRQGDRVTAARRIGSAMCGNELAWVRAGRFSDGRHREVALMLWATPSLGATTSIYRIDGGHLLRLAAFSGDRVTLGRGTVSARYENPGRSPNGHLVDTYRLAGGRYRLERSGP